MMRSNRSLTSSTTAASATGFPPIGAPGRLPVTILDAVSPLRGEADDVVVGAADRACPALDAVAEAHDRLFLHLVPLVDPGRAEVVAVLPRKALPAHLLVSDLDMGMPGVLDVTVGEQLVGELLHLWKKSKGPTGDDSARRGRRPLRRRQDHRPRLATDGSAPKDALGGAHVGMVAVAADDAGELGLRRPGSMVDRPTGVARYGRRPQRPPASRGDHGSQPRSPVQPSHGVAAAPQP